MCDRGSRAICISLARQAHEGSEKGNSLMVGESNA